MWQTWKRRLHNFVSNRAANHCWWSWRTACQSVLLPFTFSNSTSKAQKTAWKKKRSGIFPDGGCCVSNKPSSCLTSVTFYRFHIRRSVASHRNMLLSEEGAVWRVSNRLYFMARDVFFYGAHVQEEEQIWCPKWIWLQNPDGVVGVNAVGIEMAAYHQVSHQIPVSFLPNLDKLKPFLKYFSVIFFASLTGVHQCTPTTAHECDSGLWASLPWHCERWWLCSHPGGNVFLWNGSQKDP